MRLYFLIWVLVTVVSGCTTQQGMLPNQRQNFNKEEQARFDALLPDLIAEQRTAGVGIAVIRNGKVAWTRYYGEQAPGIPASSRTVFNTASVAKTLTAETLIALEAKGLIDFDEPIVGYVSHPDLVGDPRYALLTTRLLMSHRAGLLNWPYSYDDGRLSFVHDPDMQYSYSGAGVKLAARYAEAKVGKSLQNLAFEYVLTPKVIKEMSMGSIPDWAENRVAMPMDSQGKYRSIEELNASLASGEANGAADDLLVTVPAYAKLIVALIESDWLTKDQKLVREKILTSLENDAIFNCPELEWLTCPSEYGYSIGWQTFRYGDHTVIKHSGSDAGENAFVYYSPDAQHGAVIFVNGANGWVVMARVIELIGDEPLIADYYRGLIETVMGVSMPPLNTD